MTPTTGCMGNALAAALATLLAAPAHAGSISRQEAFLSLVNQVAIPQGLVTGRHQAQSDDQGCALALQPPPVGADPALQRIFRELIRSQLRTEIARYNYPRSAADRETFVVQESTCLPVRYQPAERMFRPPHVRTAHDFAVRYASDSVAVSQTRVTITTGGRDLVVSGSSEETGSLDLGSAYAASAVPRLTVLKWRGKHIGEWDRRDWSVLRNAKDSDGIYLRVTGSHGQTMAAHVERGGSISFPAGSRLHVLQKTPKGTRVLASVRWREEQGARRALLQHVDGRSVWSRAPSRFEATLADALRRAGPAINREIILSIDAALSDRLQAQLSEAIRNVDKYLRGNPRHRAVYGSVSIIDAMTGDVLVLAGLPASAPPPAYGAEYAATQQREEYLRARVVGSVAKVPVSLAILSVHPELAGLQMKPPWLGGPYFDTVLGQPVGTFEDHSATCGVPYVDFDCFIRRSLNRYAVTLISLAAVLPDPETGIFEPSATPLGDYRLVLRAGGREQTVQFQPRGFLFAKDAPGVVLVSLPWVSQLASLYDVGISAGHGEEEVSHTYVWRNALRPGAPRQLLEFFESVSPERENLKLNLATDLRGEYMQLILGGGESRWSTVKVAEAFARTVFLRRIQASFVRSERGARPPEPLKLDERAVSAHQTLLGAMEKVVSGQGTGSWAAQAVEALKRSASQKGLRLQIFAKTGTPTVDSFAEDRLNQALEKARAAGLVSWRRRPANVLGGGWEFLYRGEPASPDLVRSLPVDDAPTFGGVEEQKRTVRLLAMLNTESALDQPAYCRVQGAAIKCGNGGRAMSAGRGRDDNKGSDFAVVFSLTKQGAAAPCRAVSAAYSLSVKLPLAFQALVRSSLASDGPVAQALGLAGEEAPCPR